MEETKNIARYFVDDLMRGVDISGYGSFKFEKPTFKSFGRHDDLLETIIQINSLPIKNIFIDKKISMDHHDWINCDFCFRACDTFELSNKISMYKAVVVALNKFAKQLDKQYLNNDHFLRTINANQSVLDEHNYLVDLKDGLLSQGYVLSKKVLQMEEKLNPITHVKRNKSMLQSLLARTFSNWCQREWKNNNGFGNDLIDPRQACFDLTYVYNFTKAIELNEDNLLQIQNYIKQCLGVK